MPGLAPDAFARRVIETHLAAELKGKLRPIDERYRPRLSRA
jgi:hypothetical protein